MLGLLLSTRSQRKTLPFQMKRTISSLNIVLFRFLFLTLSFRHQSQLWSFCRVSTLYCLLRGIRMTYYIDHLTFSLEQSARIAETKSEQFVNHRIRSFGLFFAPHIIVIQKEGIISLLKENKIFQKALLEKLVVLI